MAIVIGAGGPNDRASISLATRYGTRIPNERRSERHPTALRASVELFKRERPNARLRSVTAVYNCMGLVFASRRTWVDPDYLKLILTEDEYHRVTGPQDAEVGDIVVYRNEVGDVSHVAVIVEKEPEILKASWKITVMSKWGADGEYIHLLEDVPGLLGAPAEYWTDRRLEL